MFENGPSMVLDVYTIARSHASYGTIGWTDCVYTCTGDLFRSAV